MRFARAICIVLQCCLLAGACADSSGLDAGVYVVRSDDTLYSIAWRHDLDYWDLARWNNIGQDYRIAVGQALVLAPTGGADAPTTRTVQAREMQASAGRWAWPTDAVSPPRPASSGGILLSGRLGQDVRAACPGRVVYSGSGLRGYGNLIIIKHGENLLSAYGHNREVLVREGQEVAAGQVISHMGEGAQRSPVLYFEIRQNGKPVDPLPFLPASR